MTRAVSTAVVGDEQFQAVQGVAHLDLAGEAAIGPAILGGVEHGILHGFGGREAFGFFDRYLKPGAKLPPVVLMITPRDGAEKVAPASEISVHFAPIIDERTVLVIPDNAMKRLQYEVNCIRTFYLANIAAQDIQAALSSMLRSTTRVPNIIFDKNLNSLTIRTTPQEIELVEKLIRVWDKPKGEVVIDLEIMEVSRMKERQLGISFDSNQAGLMYNGAASGSASSAA